VRPASSWHRTAGCPSVLALTITGDRIVEIDVIADPDRLGQLDLAVLSD